MKDLVYKNVHILEEFHKTNCIYLEIHTKPKSFFNGKDEEVTTPYQYIETVQTAINKFYAKRLSEKLPKVIVKLTRQLHMMQNI